MGRARTRCRSVNHAVLFALTLLLIAACASGTGGGGGNPDLITREQIAPLVDRNAFEIIRQLRPSWLRARTQGTLSNAEPAYATVMLDELRLGDISALEGISSEQIDRIEWMSAIDATTRYGTGFMGGLITVRTFAGR